jgi:hypothetical protein
MGAVDASGTPLRRKLGITDETRLVLVNAPAELIAEVSPAGTHRTTARGPADVVVAFFTRCSALERRVDGLARAVFPDGGLWIAWPKRTSGVASDLTDEEVRRVALPRGLVDNKVCAVDQTWSALRVVWRRERRTASAPPPGPLA